MLLALDTATHTASIALYDLAEMQLLAEWTWEARRRQTQDLLGAVQQMLQQSQVMPQQLSALAVTTGPGSFTGVRIAISTAKGIGLGLAEPPRVIGIPTISVTAAPWLEVAASCDPAPLICATLQAGRGRYNWLMLTPDRELDRPTAEEHHAGTTAELEAFLAQQTDQPIWLVGENRPDLVQQVETLQHVTVISPVSGLRRASQLAQLAGQHFAHGTEDSLESLQPIYLRPPG